jgi:hypothetical protein
MSLKREGKIITYMDEKWFSPTHGERNPSTYLVNHLEMKEPTPS